jgi:hypothetical protein
MCRNDIAIDVRGRIFRVGQIEKRFPRDNTRADCCDLTHDRRLEYLPFGKKPSASNGERDKCAANCRRSSSSIGSQNITIDEKSVLSKSAAIDGSPQGASN